MGPKQAKPREVPAMRHSELQEFARQSLFTQEQIEDLYAHFYTISTSVTDDGVIDFQEFSSSLNPTDTVQCASLFSLFDANRDGVINFREFLLCSSAFAPHAANTSEPEGRHLLTSAKRQEQIELSFRLFDAKNDGKVHRHALKALVQASLRTLKINLRPGQVEDIVETTLQGVTMESDPTGPFLTKETYKGLLWRNPDTLRWLAVDLDKVRQGARALHPLRRTNSKKGKCL